jgi:hypothetical protein
MTYSNGELTLANIKYVNNKVCGIGIQNLNDRTRGEKGLFLQIQSKI